MFLHDHVYAIVPARGGSKGLPGKNMMKINGKTLIELAIESARDCLYAVSYTHLTLPTNREV